MHYEDRVSGATALISSSVGIRPSGELKLCHPPITRTTAGWRPAACSFSMAVRRRVKVPIPAQLRLYVDPPRIDAYRESLSQE